MAKDHWENEAPISPRTRLAIRILFFIFKVLSPYEFEHRFEKDLKSLQDAIDSVDPPRWKVDVRDENMELSPSSSRQQNKKDSSSNDKKV